ncbi:MAG TPA: C4-dicarboxylate ABC transporter, partial [Pseudomonas sp.]|nr:C4-dicarboxylate ABC transporter [Pseudomonas sp.]
MRLTKRVGLFVAAAILANSPNAHANPASINILTGGTSGVYYPLGMSLSELYSENIEGSTTSVRATKASVENL